MRRSPWSLLSAPPRLAPADATAVPALLACVCTAVPLFALMAAGRLDVAAYAAFGAFTGLYARNEPYRLRARLLAVVGVALVVSVGIGASVGALNDSAVVHVLLVAAVGRFPRIEASVEEASALGGVRAETELLEMSHLPLLHGPRLSSRTGPTWPRFGSPEATPAGRVALAAAIAGLIAVAARLGHPYWAAVSAVAVIAPMNLSGTTHRAVQRAVGSAVGVLVGLAALVVAAGPEVTVALVIVCTGLAELTITRNYGMAMMFTTPIALMLSALGQPLSPVLLARDRIVDTVVGAVVAVAVAVLLPNRVWRTRCRSRSKPRRTLCAARQRQLSQPAGGSAFSRPQVVGSAHIVRCRGWRAVVTGHPGRGGACGRA